MDLTGDGLLDRVRQACAEVAGEARHVRIDEAALNHLAAELPPDEPALLPEERPAGAGPADGGAERGGDEESVAAEVVAWNAVNFGSGWFPPLRKRPGLSGARTLATAFAEHVRAEGPPTVASLAGADAAGCAALFGQPYPGPVDDLLALFAQAWRDLGHLLADRYDGSGAALVRSAGGSAERLVATLASQPLARDVATYDGAEVPLLKRAQITVSHLVRACEGQGLGRFTDADRLTAFADNLVPHALRMAGVLRYDDGLAGRIERGELLTPGEPAEVEIRAYGVHAVELLAARTGSTPAALDHQLWQRGQDPAVKAVPRHRCRCTYY